MALLSSTFLRAVAENNLDEVDSILSNNRIDVNVTDANGRSAAHLSAIRGSVESLHLLSNYNANLNAIDNQGNTPLHLCGHLDCASFLLDHGLRLDDVNFQCMTPVVAASRRGVSEDVIKYLNDNISLQTSDSSETFMIHPNKELGPGSYKRNICKASIWRELQEDLGWKRLFVTLLLIAALSFYIAYYFTTMATILKLTDASVK